MYHASELHNQWWEAFCGEYIQQHHQMIPREDVNHTSLPSQIGWVYEEVINCDTSSTETGSTLYASEDEISPQPSLEISRHLLPQRINPEYNNNNVTWDYTSSNIIQTTNSEQCSFEIQFHKQQCLENDSWVLDLSMNNSSQSERKNTTNVQLLCDCKTVLNNRDYVNLKNNRDNECSQNNSFINPWHSVNNESIPVYDLSTTSTSSNNGIIALMNNEIQNEVEKSYSIIDNEIPNCSEALDLSIPRNERTERVIKKSKLKLSQEIIIDDVVELETENNLPEDLPDLRFSDIRMTIPLIRSRGKTEKWIYSVRRRLLKLSTIKKMFGLDDENINEITLLYGGRGLKNPIRSNIPPFANHLNHERKYMCVYCDREFKNPKVLSRHYTQHTSYRKCFCTVCWRGFYDSYDLKRHLEKHQEITVFYCELCESIYSQNITKETHYRNIHRHIYSIA